VCEERGQRRDYVEMFWGRMRRHFQGNLKSPFNVEARERVGRVKETYEGELEGIAVLEMLPCPSTTM